MTIGLTRFGGSLEKPIMEAFTELKRDVQKNGSTSFHEKWNEFISLYDLIYPSLTIDVSEDQLETVGKHIDVIEQEEFQQMTESTKLERLSLLQHDLKNVFDRVEEDDADPSLLWVIITTGSIIITALTYVGYRKYKAEKNKLKKGTTLNKDEGRRSAAFFLLHVSAEEDFYFHQA